jgi:hypothetical protein
MFAINEKVTAAGQLASRIREGRFAKKGTGSNFRRWHDP